MSDINFLNNYAVNVYDISGRLIGNWASASEAMQALHVKNSGNVRSCLCGDRSNADGYIWKYISMPVPLLENEIWKPVVGFEQLYAVSNKGRVASVQFHGKQTFTILKQSSDKLNYKYVKIRDWRRNIVKSYPVHRLVAEAFIENPENKPQVDHIDTNPANNTIENLRWATNLENQRNPITLKRLQDSIIQLNKRKVGPTKSAELKRIKVKQIVNNETSVYNSYTEAASIVGHSVSTIRRWCMNNENGWEIIKNLEL